MNHSIISVTFIIPTINEANLLPVLLQSIKALDSNEQCSVEECIVVDAGSTDDTLAIASSFGCRIVHSSIGNISKSRNAGAKAARGDILAFIDADCELPSNWLVEVVAQLAADNTVAVGMSMHLNQSATWVERTWYELAYKNHHDAAASQVTWLPSFNMAVKIRIFDTVGGFDEKLVTSEDYELGTRLAKHGTLYRVEAENGVFHHGESKTVPEFMHREAWRANGEINLMRKDGKSIKTILSFLLPIVVVSGMILGLLIAIFSLLLGTFNGYHLLASVAFGAIPVLLLVLRRKISIKRLVPSWTLLSIYFISRTIGLFRQFSRVAR